MIVRRTDKKAYRRSCATWYFQNPYNTKFVVTSEKCFFWWGKARGLCSCQQSCTWRCTIVVKWWTVLRARTCARISARGKRMLYAKCEVVWRKGLWSLQGQHSKANINWIDSSCAFQTYSPLNFSSTMRYVVLQSTARLECDIAFRSSIETGVRIRLYDSFMLVPKV